MNRKNWNVHPTEDSFDAKNSQIYYCTCDDWQKIINETKFSADFPNITYTFHQS